MDSDNSMSFHSCHIAKTDKRINEYGNIICHRDMGFVLNVMSIL